MSLAACPVPAADPDPFGESSVGWRPYGVGTFEEASATGRPIFLVLTAAWTWDHFLLPVRVFRDAEVIRRLERDWIPVMADVDAYPELRPLHRIGSGLVPSFHFLAADGRPLASFPPMDVEELVYYLDEYVASPPAVSPPEPPAPVLLELNPDKLTNRLGRVLLDLYESGERTLPVVHDDLDFSDLHFFTEYGRFRLRRRTGALVTRDLRTLLASDLFDEEYGGVHRSAALDDGSAVHYEKLLRQNAEAGAVLAGWSRVRGGRALSAAALLTLRFLNDQLRTGMHALYRGSLSADVFDGQTLELVMRGSEYYAMNRGAREAVGEPVASGGIPVGGNFLMQQALVQYYRTWGDDRMRRAMVDTGPSLLEGAFEADGTARRFLGKPGVGNLRDQADAGAGLLAYHAVSGDPAALAAAERVGEGLLDRFWMDGPRAFRNVAAGSGLGARVENAPPHPAWNGAALRFLVELGRVTGEERWWRLARSSLDGWSHRIPADGTGAGELGRAALRADRRMGLVLIDAEPAADEGRRLMTMAVRGTSPVGLVRWVRPEERAELERAFGVRFEEEPAAYLVWTDASTGLRDPEAFEEEWIRELNRVW